MLIGAGVLILLFVVYQLWGTGIQEARAQNKLENEFESIIATTPAPTTTRETTTRPASASSTAPTTTVAPAAVPPPVVEPGDPLARIEIPKIDVDKIVVAGVGVSDLRKGPGHYPQTPMPGQVGNSAIAGHRTTYGAPFFRSRRARSGRHHRGDDRAGAVPVPRDRDADREADRLQRARSDARRHAHAHVLQPAVQLARQRIIVKARLDTSVQDALPAAVTTVVAPPVDNGDEQTIVEPIEDPTIAALDSFSAGWFSDSSAWLPTILWGLLATAVAVGFWFLGRHWKRWAAYLLAVIPFLFVLYFFYENVARLLPPNI